VIRLRDRNPLFQALVRALDLNANPVSDLVTCDASAVCPDHGLRPHYRRDGFTACEACVARSRALAEIGRAGGRKGGAANTPAKREAWARARSRRWPGKPPETLPESEKVKP